ncbi:MAG: hypothetical protein WC781_05385 [Candidatus Pacearchaeota archaeon]|jgi:hypothetical protein
MKTKIQLSKEVKVMLSIDKIENGLVYCKDYSVKKIFKINSPNFPSISEHDKQQFVAKFKRYISQIKTPNQILVKTNNYYSNTFLSRVNAEIKSITLTEEQKSHLKELNNMIASDFLKYDARLERVYYLIISFDGFEEKDYTPEQKKILEKINAIDEKARNTKNEKKQLELAKISIELRHKTMDSVVFNQKKREELNTFLNEQIQILRENFDLNELTDEESRSLMNSYFFESIYVNNLYYNIHDFINVLGEKKNLEENSSFYDIHKLFLWKQNNYFTKFKINGQFNQITSVYAYPKYIERDTFLRILDYQGNFDVSMFITPCDKTKVLEYCELLLKDKLDKKEGLRTLDLSDERLNKEVEELKLNVSHIKEQNNIYFMSLYFNLKDFTDDSLDMFKQKMIIRLNEKFITKDLSSGNLIQDILVVNPLCWNNMKAYKRFALNAIGNMYPFVYDFRLNDNQERVKSGTNLSKDDEGTK